MLIYRWSVFVAASLASALLQRAVRLELELGVKPIGPIGVVLGRHHLPEDYGGQEQHNPFEGDPGCLVVELVVQLSHLGRVLGGHPVVGGVLDEPVPQLEHPDEVVHSVVERQASEITQLDAAALQHLLPLDQLVKNRPDHNNDYMDPLRWALSRPPPLLWEGGRGLPGVFGKCMSVNNKYSNEGKSDTEPT
jgi:hypothetical protein